MAFRIIVCGTRTFTGERAEGKIRFTLEAFEAPVVIVHGACEGPDTIAADIALDLGFEVEPHPAAWKQFGRSAGPRRNRAMASLGADLCIAFWDGHSSGTLDMISAAVYQAIPVTIIPTRPSDVIETPPREFTHRHTNAHRSSERRQTSRDQAPPRT